MTCGSCGAALPTAQRFCGECGAPVRAAQVIRDDPLRDELAAALGATYELGRLLGRGGMGAVYLARERALDRMVAVKVLPPEISNSEESRERFRREARTAARLTHQNIVPLYTFGETAGLVFYVMGYVRGDSLADRLRTQGRLSAETARDILSELASALDYAHRRGVIHRDIKPDNILIEAETGRALLTDFGIAKATSAGATLTVDGAILGTPLYMSPEQASGERALDGRSDLYSLGVLGYAMLTGKPPFEGSGAQEIIAQHLTREPPPLVVAGVPDDLALSLRRCLAKDPARRWNSASDLHAALKMADGDEVELPETLEAARGGGLAVLGTSVAIGMGAWYFRLFPPGNEHGVPFWVFLTGLAALVPAALPWMHRHVRREGLSRESAWRLLFHLPDWMTQVGPWPKLFRRKGDVWHRLPKPVRVARAFLWASYASMLLGLPAQLMYRNSDRWNPEPKWIATERQYVGGWSTARLLFHEMAFSVTYLTMFMGPLALGMLYGRRRGLSQNDAAKLLFAPTRGTAFWKKAEIQAVLLPESGVEPRVASEPRVALEFHQAVRELAGQLPSSQQMLGAEAVAAARQAMDGIAALETQIRTLERDADTAEIARLEQRIANPGDSTSDETSAMRGLLSSQLELLRRMQGRLEEARARHARLTEALRTLWLQLADLRAAAAQDDVVAADLTGRLRALCNEMQRQVEAGDAVAAILPAVRHTT